MGAERKTRRQKLREATAEAADLALTVGTDQLARLADYIQPGAGSPIALAGGVAGHLVLRHAQRQVEQLLTELHDRVDLLDHLGRLDRERLDSIEDLLGRAVIAAVADDPRKTEAYADLLAGIISTDSPAELDQDTLLRLLQTLSAGEVALAAELVRLYESDTFAAASGIVPPDWGADTVFYLKRLAGSGLIAEVPDSFGPPSKLTGGRVELTPTLQRLVSTLRNGRPVAPQKPGKAADALPEDNEACCVCGKPATHKPIFSHDMVTWTDADGGETRTVHIEQRQVPFCDEDFRLVTSRSVWPGYCAACNRWRGFNNPCPRCGRGLIFTH